MEKNVTCAQRIRLIRIFREDGTRMILRHLDDLEGSFGTGAIVIRKVMEGKLPKDRGFEDPVFDSELLLHFEIPRCSKAEI